MRCDRCGRDAVHFQPYSGLRLCGEHLVASLEARAKGTIRARGWIQPGDRIAVSLSGGPSGSSLLHFLATHFGMRRDLSLVAITTGEGGISDREMARIRGIAEGTGVEWVGEAVPGESRDHPEELRADIAGSPFSPPPWLRERALTSLAGKLGATKLALGTSLDDEAGSVFLRVIRGEAAQLRGDQVEPGGTIPLIRPFSRIPEEELFLYARLKGIEAVPVGRLPARDPLEGEAARMLADYTLRHPSALFSLASIGEALAEGRAAHD